MAEFQQVMNELNNLRQTLLNEVEEEFLKDEDEEFYSIWQLSSLQTDGEPHFNRTIFNDFEEGEERNWCKKIIWDYNLINLSCGMVGVVGMPDGWIYKFVSLDEFEPF